MADEVQGGDETFICVKCGKKKKMSEPHYEQDGGKYCCEDCCGKGKEGELCEFC